MSDEPPQLTREQAEASLKIVRTWLARKHSQWAANNATLYEPGFHCDGWAIALDGGPEDWPWHVSQDIGEKDWPIGVYAEPGSRWYLGLYPD